jgi:GH25 family lysozyme M1 (1,4-beta-N-acetylmuramidase)
MEVQQQGNAGTLFQTADRFVRIVLAVFGIALCATAAGASDFSEPWKRPDRALVIDAYEYNPIDWQRLAGDKRIVGFINKASDGLPPPYKCSGRETEIRLCKALWKRHAVARELFHTRKTVAKALGLKWGAYHLARPGNPIDQANNFIDFAEPGPDDLIALDIEENDPGKWMSLDDAETFVRHIKARLGRWPVLYTNGATALHIAENRDRYSLLSRLPLWYARYKPAIGLHFPKGHWQTYTLWQFSAGVNCDARSCPYRVPGTPLDIDVNVASMNAKELRAEWPFGDLIDATAGPVATAESVPLPIPRRIALEGGDVTVEYADVVESDEQLTPALAAAAAAKVRGEVLEVGYAPAEPAVQTAAFQAFDALAAPANGKKVPLPISRQTALEGGDVTLRFAPVEEEKGSRSIFPAALMLPTDIFIGQPAEAPTPVELASYKQAVEKARRLGLQVAPENRSVDRSGTISAAALDDPGPIVSASQFTRADLPVFLLKKIDGAGKTP